MNIKDDKKSTSNGALTALGAVEIVEGTAPLTIEQERAGRERRKIESRVAGVSTESKAAS